MTNANTMEIQNTNKFTAFEIVNLVRYFGPVLSSIGAILLVVFGHSNIATAIAGILIAFGTLCAVTVCPLKLLVFPFKCIITGFTICRGFIPVYGVADLCAAIFGTIGGFMVGMGIVLFCPAFFTIKKYLENE